MSARAPCLHSQCHAQIKFAGKETVDRLEYETDRGHVQTVCLHALRTACMCHCDSLSACVHAHNFRLRSTCSLETGLRTFVQLFVCDAWPELVMVHLPVHQLFTRVLHAVHCPAPSSLLHVCSAPTVPCV
jgi:hypothetical protein